MLPLLVPSLAAYDLRVENVHEPLAIQRSAPHFSWKLRATDPGAQGLKQSGYHLLVASDPALLARNRGDVWDTGRVASAETYGIEYTGPALATKTRFWWKVKVFDQNQQASEWSAPATFGTGLAPQDWQAKWIGGHRKMPDSAFLDAGWMWASDGPFGQSPAAKHVFVRDFDIDPRDLKSAVLHITADDQFTVEVNGRWAGASDGRADAWKRPQAISILSHLRPGQNQIRVTAENQSVGYAGVLASLVVETTYGTQGTFIRTPTNWRVEGGQIVAWGGYTRSPWGVLRATDSPPAEYFRREFDVDEGLVRATLYFSAKGLIDPYLNGRPVTEELFSPGWTDYDHRIQYKALDVTKRLKHGQNAMGAVLGDGWYSGAIGWLAERNHYGSDIGILMQLELEYADGRRTSVVTGETWQTGSGGVVQQDFLMGEVFDARREQAAWSLPRFQSEGWRPAVVQEPYSGELEAFVSYPVKPYETRPAQQIIDRGNGVYILDFGQNLAGFCRLKVSGEAGQTITLRHAEVLDENGDLYTANLRLAKATDTYICRGGEEETWTPRFTFHGFRYVEVTGLKSAPDAETIQAVAISSATPEVRTFVTSDPMLNQLASNAWWTQKMNFIDVPTDCPQRDERLGWTGDAQAYIRTAALYSDVQAFFDRWLESLRDGQLADGNFPSVAPSRISIEDGGPAWADAGVICPWQIYLLYGDRRLLAENYPAMKRFVEFNRARSGDDLLPPDQFHCFGDWLSINANTPNDVIYQGYHVGSAQIVADAAAVLGFEEDAAEYQALADKLKEAFRRAYIDADGRVKGNTQCGYVLALGFDIVEGEQFEQAATHLVADIEARGWHLSTGFVGTRDILYVLSKIGRQDVALRLLHNKTFPSWGFEIENGATTIWERWDGWTPERGFQDPGMNSFAHYAYGAVMGWVFENVGGISPLAPGFERVRIAPVFDPNLRWSRTRYDSVRGPISCDWERTSSGIVVTIEVPPNVEAMVFLPPQSARQVGSGRHVFRVVVD